MPVSDSSMSNNANIPTNRLPAWVYWHAPKRENFRTVEEYEEAFGYFLHRFKHLASRPSNSADDEPSSETKIGD
jgi:hypothetical protein